MSEKQMQDGVWYDLDPPVVIPKIRGQGKETYRHVLCEYQVPGHPDEYSVRGVPDGETEEKPFILRFTKTGIVKISLSQKQTA